MKTLTRTSSITVNLFFVIYILLLSPVALAFTDDFNGTQLNSLWTFVNPLSDASISLNSGRLAINIPAGVSHDVWINSNKAPRIMQPVPDADMTLEVKFDSELNSKYQMQGLLVQQDPANFLRFDLYSTGSSVRAFAADFTDSSVTVRQDKAITKGAPYYLRLQRTADTWTCSYSYDGSAYANVTSFNRSLTVTSIGLFAANHGSGTSVPAFTGLADYFYTDASSASDTYTLTVNVTGSGTVTRNPDKSAYQPGESVELTAVPAQSWLFSGWSDALSGTANPQTLTINSDTTVTAIFTQQGPPPPASNLLSDDFVGERLDEQVWTVTDPIGDSSIAIDGTHLVIDVPGGVSHAPPAFSSDSEANLVLHMKFDDPPNDGVLDSSAYSNNGSTAAVLPAQVQGVLGQAYAFDGSDRHIAIPDNNSLDLEKLTLSAWLYVTKYTNDQRIISKEFGTSQPYSIYTLLLSGTGEKFLELRIAINGKRKSLTSIAPVPLGTWTHVAATYDQTRIALYIDGRLDIDAPVTGPIQTNDQPLWLAASQFYQPRYFNGRIDDIRVYDGALSPDQVASLAALQEPPTAARENRAPHVTQPLRNADFEIQAKFDSALAKANQVQGIIVKQDLDNLVCFDIYNDGSAVRAFAAVLAAGNLLVEADTPIAAQPPYYLAVRRAADQWTLSRSSNGANWTTVADFQHTLIADSVGPYAGNFGGDSPAPAFTSEIDYFYNTAPPAIENIQLAPLARSIAVSWQTSVPTTGYVPYGTTPDYELGRVNDPILYTEHTVLLDGLQPGAAYNLRIIAEENGGETPSTNIIAKTNTVWSDQFSGSQLNTQIWTFLDPMQDAQLAVANGRVSISVPEGVSHDFGASLSPVPRIMQQTEDADFELEAKFDSRPSLQYQMQGLLVEEDSGNFLRYEIYSDGSQLHLFAAHLCNGNSTVIIDTPLNDPAPYYLRISRRAYEWTLYYSADSVNWLNIAGFTTARAAHTAGLFVANHGATSNIPAFTAVADYFTNTLTPLSAPAPVPDEYILTVNILGSGTVAVDPDQPTYQAGQTVQLTAAPAQDWAFAGYSGDIQTTANPASLTISADTSITALFTQNTSGSPINIWYGKTQSFGQIGKPQRWVNILGNLQNASQFDSLTYSINGQTAMPLTLGPDNPRLEDVGDFNVELAFTDLNPGVNQVVITAAKTTGQVVTETVTVNYNAGNIWPPNYSINWNNVTNIQNVAQVVDGKWALVPGGVRSIVEGYDRLIAIGDMTWSDYEITVPITINQSYHDPAQTGTRPAVGLLMRWTGHVAWSSTEQPRTGWWPMGAIGHFRWGTGDTGAHFILGNEGTKLASNSSLGVPQNGVRYIYKMRVETVSGQGGRYSLKVWRDGQPEPSQWLMTAQEKLSDPQNGSLLLLAHHVDATFGNVTITGLN